MSEATLISILEELEDASKELQGHLVARDPQGIMSVLKKQEQVVESLSRIPEESSQELHDVSRRNPRVRSLLERSRSLLRTNRALSLTFLQVIDHALGQLGGTPAPAGAGYGPALNAARPLFIRQQG